MKAVAYTYFSGPVRIKVVSKVYDTFYRKWFYNCVVTSKNNPTYKLGQEFYTMVSEVYANHKFKGSGGVYTGRIDFDSIPLE